MDVGRRGFLSLLARAAALLLGTRLCDWPRPAGATATGGLELRNVRSADAPALRSIMTSCVAGADAFFGTCGDWSLSWAEELIARCPETVVLLRDATPVAFLELPPIRPPSPPPGSNASPGLQEAYRTRERSRTTFRVTAAGVRDDLLDAEDSVRLFRALLFRAFSRARELGYETVAPWDQHPRLGKRWTDYPGCEFVEPPSISPADGRALYWLRWRLEEAIGALEAEGAAKQDLVLRFRAPAEAKAGPVSVARSGQRFRQPS